MISENKKPPLDASSFQRETELACHGGLSYMLDTNGYKPSNGDDEVVRKKLFYICYTYRTSCLFQNINT
jgi:hypothetical protein